MPRPPPYAIKARAATGTNTDGAESRRHSGRQPRRDGRVSTTTGRSIVVPIDPAGWILSVPAHHVDYDVSRAGGVIEVNLAVRAHLDHHHVGNRCPGCEVEVGRQRPR